LTTIGTGFESTFGEAGADLPAGCPQTGRYDGGMVAMSTVTDWDS